MAFANNFDPDEAPQNVMFHQRSKLLTLLSCIRKRLIGSNEFLQISKGKKKERII